MAKRMIIDANHPEETRVVVLSGKRIEEFDYETAARSQLKGNIYLAKITRVEPSLQAAFVEYGGNRHGFLPFSEIHPDYYKIPIADRQALAAEEAALRGDTMGEEEIDANNGNGSGNGNGRVISEEVPSEPMAAAPEDPNGEPPNEAGDQPGDQPGEETGEETGDAPDGPPEQGAAVGQTNEVEQVDVEPRVDTIGGDEIDDQRRRRANLLRRYKIQEVIKRRQVILVQVSKEERGTKGAALTTYLSLAGRYCVLMPNTARGGGISRKIGSANDRRRLKSILGELEIPDGMAVIVRTAGSQRSKAEIRRDYEYLMRLWDEIRKTTLQSTAPCLIHEEANLIKRSIRDLYSRDMDDVWVQGEAGYKTAKAFMRSLMPSHAKKVQQYKDQSTPIFHHYQVEGQLEAMHSPTVQLKAGGYIVLNQTEALVAIDVNSGRATRERHIEVTALKTNLEAAEEVARQLRLRDLAGLVVVDFIDMEEPRHNRDVERKLKEAMRSDRARIQLGRVSPFGLLEMSRQRLRPSLFESSTESCPRCDGTGHVRSVYSSALAVLRNLEEEGLRGRDGEIRVAVPTAVALYLLNEFRNRLIEVEQRYGFKVTVDADDKLLSDDYRLDRVTPSSSPAAEAVAEEDDSGRKRRRGRRRRKAGEEEGAGEDVRPAEPDAELEASEPEGREETREAAGETDDVKKGRRRRGRRGGRRRSRRRPEAQEGASPEAPDEATTVPSPMATEEPGPTEVVVAEVVVAEGVVAEGVVAEDAVAETPSQTAAQAPEEAAAEAPRASRRGRPRKARAKPAPAEDTGSEDATVGSQPSAGANGEPSGEPGGDPGGDPGAESEAGGPPKRTRSPPARRPRQARGVRKPREPEQNATEEAAPAPEGRNSEPSPVSGAHTAPCGPERIEAPDRSGQGDLPAAASAPETGPDGDDGDLPKRRGWWNRWV
jgi:ribonuclease E